MAILSVAVLCVALAGQAQDPRAEAERLARAGSHAEALQRFQALVAANPDDIEARLWIARLHREMGHTNRSVEVYRSIVATNPQNLEALLGLGLTLIDSGNLTQAADALSRAEALAPDRPAVLAAQGRVHGRAARTTLALAYYERALALEPGNTEARAEYDALRAGRAHRVEGTYYFERFSDDLPNTHAGIFKVNGRVTDRFRVFGAAQFQRKFSHDESGFGGGIEWTARHDLRTRVFAMGGVDALLLPESEFSADVEFDRRSVTWLGRFRYLDFAGSRSTIVSPGVAFSLTDTLRLAFRYFHSESDIEDLLDDISNDGVSLDAAATLTPRASVHVGYARGFESLSRIMNDRFALLDGNIATAGARFEVAPMSTFAVAYQHQWRDDDTNVATAYVTFIQRF
jgi:tetratricopeptide (TPR) repeat protein